MNLGALIVILGSATAGQYIGRINLHSVDADPAIRKKLEPVLDQARSIRIHLDLRPNGSYQLTRGKGSIFDAETTSGRWAKIDGMVALMPQRVNSKVTNRPSQFLSPRKDGWVMKLEPVADLRGEITFYRKK
jgi:hypothetical protein